MQAQGGPSRAELWDQGKKGGATTEQSVCDGLKPDRGKEGSGGLLEFCLKGNRATVAMEEGGEGVRTVTPSLLLRCELALIHREAGCQKRFALVTPHLLFF